MNEEVKIQEKEIVQPNAAVISMQLLQALLQYLDTQPRGAVNQLAMALEQSRTVHIKEDAVESADARPEAKELVAQ
jgi:hypothetical protein